MKIKVNCKGCSKIFKIGEKYSGKKIHCPFCKNIVNVPIVQETEEEPAQTPKGKKEKPQVKTKRRKRETRRVSIPKKTPRRRQPEQEKKGIMLALILAGVGVVGVILIVIFWPRGEEANPFLEKKTKSKKQRRSDAEKLNEEYEKKRDETVKRDNDIKGHLEMAKWCNKKYLTEKAQYHISKVLKSDRGNVYARKMAKDLLREYLSSKKPKTADTRIKAAEYCMKMYYIEGAKVQIRRALQLDPDNEEAKKMKEKLEKIE